MRKAGWTLVEALVVIAILLTLMAIVWAVWQPVRDRELQAVCASKMRQIWMALESYRQDYRGLDPPFAKNPSDAGLPATIRQKEKFIASYMQKHPNGWVCPTGRPNRHFVGMACSFPCGLAPSGEPIFCQMETCSLYQLTYYSEDLLDDLPKWARSGAEAALRCDRFLFQQMGPNYILLYDDCHRHNLEELARVYTLLIHLDGHFQARTIPHFLAYQTNLCEELGGGG